MTQDRQNRVQDAMRDILKAHGLRYSKPREKILHYFGERDTHVSAEGLYLDLKRRGQDLSLSTVYLNLGVLKNAGLIREFTGVNGEALYDSNVGPHHHLICKQCGEVLDLPETLIEGSAPARFLRKRAEAISGWHVDEPNLDLYGLCPTCLDSDEP